MEVLLACACLAYIPAPKPPERGGSEMLSSRIAQLAAQAVSWQPGQGRERDGTWCHEPYKQELVEALRGLRGAKQAWWLDSPQPLRAVLARGDRYEVSVLALPGETRVAPAAYPAGSVLLLQPLAGELECRRLRLQMQAPPIELMRKTLLAGAPSKSAPRRGVAREPLHLFGGCCHEFIGKPGIASAMLQVVLLPPTSEFPADGCGLGWGAPPAEGCADNTDTVLGATIDGGSVDDLIELTRQSLTRLCLAFVRTHSTRPLHGGLPRQDDHHTLCIRRDHLSMSHLKKTPEMKCHRRMIHRRVFFFQFDEQAATFHFARAGGSKRAE